MAPMFSATLSIGQGILAPTSVPLPTEMSARHFIEAAFGELQTAQNLDPFTITLEYYGFDNFQGNKAYLGYMLVCVSKNQQSYPANSQRYWEVFVNGNPSCCGIDSLLVKPGDKVFLDLAQIASCPAGGGPRRMHARRGRPGPNAG